jgi:hypothetical protein
MQFFFLKIVKIETANKVQSFFPERDLFSARKTSLFISFTEWDEPKLSLYVWTYLTWHNFLLFSREIFEEVLCVARTALK